MQARLNHRQASPDAMKTLSDMRTYLHNCGLDRKLRVLIELRVSQINGCAYCVDLHANEARAEGETQQGLDCLGVWREVPFFDARKRTALAWAEALSLIAETHAPDDIHAEVSVQFSAKELVDLSLAIAA